MPVGAPARLTLGQVFALASLLVAVLVTALLLLLTDTSRRSLLETSERVREQVADRTEARVQDWLAGAQEALDDVERQVQRGVVDPSDPAAVEAALFARMLANPDLGELTFTRSTATGYDEQGDAVLAPTRWQMSVVRTAGDEPHLVSRYTSGEGAFQRTERDRAPGMGLAEVAFGDPVAVDDPTEHLTFSVPASNRLLGRVSGVGRGLWTDLHYSELDSHLPHDRQRVVVAVMKRAHDGDGGFLGVLRAALDARGIDAIVASEPGDPHRIVLTDDQGRLVSRLSAGDPIVEEPDESLRARPVSMPPEIAAATGVTDLAWANRRASARLDVDGEPWLATYIYLPGTQDWQAVVVVPEGVYLADLLAARNRLLGLAAAIVIPLVLVGAIALRSVRRGLGAVADAAGRMRDFDFAPAPSRAPFRDVHEVLDSLERSKTALRALGKYVPMDLVRQLYRSNREPVLGGELAEVTLLFSDIVGFTSIAEKLPPNELAQLLGRYLEVVTQTIHGERGTIDKYIGDAVMALWNVPTPCDEPAVRACRAALACVEALRRLEASPEWVGRPPLTTRFGLHGDRVMVGHFGAPDRLSYTVIGDGVNLASRLEGLNKQYGTTILVSETIEAAARGRFAFRCLDVVAVKGKQRPVRVYELRAEAAPASEAYERAFQAYLARDFEGALAILGAITDDPPARVLEARCRTLRERPPGADWDGVFVATTK